MMTCLWPQAQLKSRLIVSISTWPFQNRADGQGLIRLMKSFLGKRAAAFESDRNDLGRVLLLNRVQHGGDN